MAKSKIIGFQMNLALGRCLRMEAVRHDLYWPAFIRQTWVEKLVELNLRRSGRPHDRRATDEVNHDWFCSCRDKPAHHLGERAAGQAAKTRRKGPSLMAAGAAYLPNWGAVAVDLAPSAGKAEPTSAGPKPAPARSLASPDREDEHDDILAAAVTGNTNQ